MQLVHRGWNPDSHPRRTLHGALWTADTPVMMHEQGQELHLHAALAHLDAAQQQQPQQQQAAMAREWAEYLRGYLRECPVDATEAGSMLKFLRTHQRRSRAAGATATNAAGGGGAAAAGARL
jgi:hypothetical protein